jgi:lactoylglutathione lyase
MLALETIRQLDYTVIFARDMARMREFYGEVMRFPIRRALSPQWIEYGVGSNVLALTERGMMWEDAPPPAGALSLQLAFRVPPGDVDRCAAELRASGIEIVLEPANQPWGHRTVFFRDPDGNVIEIYAEI